MDGTSALGESALGELSGDIFIYPDSIASAEAWGEPTITSDVYSILPSSIDTAEAWGSPSIETTIEPASIASAEAFGSPTITQSVTYKPVSRIR